MEKDYIETNVAGKTWTVEIPDSKDDVIFYADMTPCDDMHNYKEIEIPTFVKDDTPHFDTEDAWVIQVATRFGWAIVAKWRNNGSTRIYGLCAGVVADAAAILGGPCDSGVCVPAHGIYEIKYTNVSNQYDLCVFQGINYMYWEYCQYEENHKA